jgi:predicted acetyltransferase
MTHNALYKKVELLPARIELKPVIKNLARFYVYEFSKYNEEDFPEDGLYEPYESCFHFDHYWSEEGYHPFVIRVDDKLAGFVLLNKNGSSSNADWYLAEFYIAAKFQKKGIGRRIALQLLNKFHGTWEITQMPNNLPAIIFWRSVIQQFTKGQYKEERQQIQTPDPHEMIVHTFRSS